MPERRLYSHTQRSSYFYDEAGHSPIHLSAISNCSDVLNCLLLKGVDVNICNARKSTPIHLAIMNQSMACVDRLLKVPNVDVNAKDAIQRTPLHYAVLIKNTGLVRSLMEMGSEPTARCEDGTEARKLVFTPYDFARMVEYQEGMEILEPFKTAHE